MKNVKIAKPIYLAITALIFMLLNDLGIVNITPEKWDSYVNLVAIILMGVGIMTNPISEIPVDEEPQEKIAE